ncbi:MAG: Ig-like domain-containing protein, partial [Firmicutes bacterium]|nr:Ig-like domain-containing protein [Bacillota bacterium]
MATYNPGDTITIAKDTVLYAIWKENITGPTLPDVTLSAVTAITSTSARLNAVVVTSDDSLIYGRKFVYFEKNNGNSVYQIDADENFSADISNLKPETEYWFYASANNIVGYGNSVYGSFKTLSADNEVPVAIELTPANITVKTGASITLATRITPVGAKNKNIVWESSDESVATVDSNGVIRGIKEGKAIITATTEIGRLKATCNVTVTDSEAEMDLSEWNMYSQTRSTGAKKYNLGFTGGGNIQMASAYLSSWIGPVNEDDDPYPRAGSTSVQDTKTRYHAQEILYIPNRED